MLYLWKQEFGEHMSGSMFSQIERRGLGEGEKRIQRDQGQETYTRELCAVRSPRISVPPEFSAQSQETRSQRPSGRSRCAVQKPWGGGAGLPKHPLREGSPLPQGSQVGRQEPRLQVLHLQNCRVSDDN